MTLSRGGNGGKTSAEVQMLECEFRKWKAEKAREMDGWMDVAAKGNNHFLCLELF